MIAFLGFLAVAGLGIFSGGSNASTVDNNQTIIESSVDADGDYLIVKKTYRLPVKQVQQINGSMHVSHASFTTSMTESNELMSVQIVDPNYFNCDMEVDSDKYAYREKCIERKTPKSKEEAESESLKAISTIISLSRPAVNN